MSADPTYAPQGDIVVSTVEAMKLELRQLVASSSGDLTIDLARVEMIDSKGLGLLIATFNSLDSAGRKLRIRAASPDLVELFRLMRLDRHFIVE